MNTPAELIQRQIELEEEMRGLGISRYLRKMEASEEAELPPGMMMLRRTLAKMATALEFWVKEVKGGQARRYASIADTYLLVGIPEAAYIAVRCSVNAISSKLKTTAFAVSLGGTIAEEIEYHAFKKADPKMFKRVSDMVKDSGNATYRSKVMHMMRRRAGVEDLGWDKETKLRVGMKLIELVVEYTGLIELVTVSEGKNSSVHYVMGTQMARDWMAKQHEHCQLLSPLHLPMLCKPNEWETPLAGGYFTHQMNMVKTPNKNYLSELEHHDMPIVYSGLNALQNTSWRVNKRILEVMEQLWELGGDRAGLPHKDPRPLPNRPLDIDTNPEALKEWKFAAKTIYTFNHRNVGKVVGVAQKLWVANKFKDEKEIFYVWTLDWRGRAYPTGSFMHPQSDDTGKALLEFSQGKPLGEAGWRWLAVQLANTFGEDKVTYEDRIHWAIEHNDAIRSYAQDPLVNRGWMDADAPFGFLAACMEWEGYITEGPNHICHLPIQVDGSCNGLQNFSALLLDPIGGNATNLVPSDKPQDIYGLVAQKASEFMVEDAKKGVLEAEVFLGNYGRKWTKRNCMTYAYSVSLFGMRDQMLEEFRKAKDSGHPIDYRDSDEYRVAAYCAGLNLRAIGSTVVAAKNAMDWLKEVAKVAASDGLPVFWTNPAGMPIHQSYRATTGKRVRVNIGGKMTEFMLQVEGTKMDGRKQSAGIAPNVIHSFDAGHMMRTIAMGVAEGMADFSFIHDSYGTHACDMDNLSALLREAFVDQYSNDLLGKFREEIVEQLSSSGSDGLVDRLPPTPERGTLDLERVLESRYFFA